MTSVMYTDAMTLEIAKDMQVKLKADSSTVASVSKSLYTSQSGFVRL